MTGKTISRRKFVRGAASVTAAGATAALFGGSMAKAAAGIGRVAPTGVIGNGIGANGSVDLFKHHCSLVHKAMGDKMTRIVADPDISSRDTAHALRTTFCPCCKTQINASFPAVPWNEIGKAYG